MHLSPKFCWEIYWSSGTNRESQAETGGHFQEEGQVLHQPLWNWGQSSCARPREQTLEYPKELRLILCFMDNMDPCSPHGSLPPPPSRESWIPTPIKIMVPSISKNFQRALCHFLFLHIVLSQIVEILPIFYQIKDKIATFYQLLYTFFEYLRHHQILLRIMR